MVPLIWFLFAWLALMAIFAIGTFLTVSVLLRYGVAEPTTYVSAALFLGVITVVLLVTSSYLFSVDWSASINLFGNVRPSLY